MRASAGISSGSSSSSALNTDATVGLATGFAAPPRLILIGALGLLKSIEILVMRGGGGGAGTSSDSSHSREFLCLLSKTKQKKYRFRKW